MQSANDICQVLSAGGVYNNTDLLRDAYKNRIDLFLQDCKFNICLENTNSEGYVTEKLFQSFVNGSIPIYWGSNGNPEPEILTGNGILFFNPERPKEIQHVLRELLHSKEALTSFLSKPVFKANAAFVIQNKLDVLKEELTRLLGIGA